MVRKLVAVLCAAVVAAVPSAARADAPPPAKVLSNFETSAPGNVVNRDCGFSEKIPGVQQSLWLFCDSEWSGTWSGFWLGATAARGPYTPGQVPTGITELPTPPAAVGTLPSNRPPSGFLPKPTGLVLPDGTECTVPGSAYQASWITGVARQPSTANPNKMLIVYTDVCVHPQDMTGEGFGLVEYDPSTNTLSGQKRVFTEPSGLPFQKILGSPVFRDGYLYLYGFKCDSIVWGGCTAGKTTVARVAANPASWQNASSYRYWTGSAWDADHNAAASVVPSATPVAVHVDDFSSVGKGLILIEQPSIAGDFRVWRASSPTGPWTLLTTGTAPCGAQSGWNLCRAYFGHPELSTSSAMLMSYYDPTDNHVSVMSVPW
ncbi:hypothetical protein ABGB12_09990 [Actinocorallia sp. B10E7]|uniref:hypothetical protein n=1 Tax=Actinocorallia sp. B10E7 TaxID=3153558 RepID=UPI00325E9642